MPVSPQGLTVNCPFSTMSHLSSLLGRSPVLILLFISEIITQEPEAQQGQRYCSHPGVRTFRGGLKDGGSGYRRWCYLRQRVVSGSSTVLLQLFCFVLFFYFYNFALMFYINVCLFLCLSFLLFSVCNYFMDTL